MLFKRFRLCDPASADGVLSLHRLIALLRRAMKKIILGFATTFALTTCATMPTDQSHWQQWANGLEAAYTAGPTAILKNVDYTYLPEGETAYVVKLGDELDLTTKPGDDANIVWRIRHEKGDVLWSPISADAKMPETGVIDRVLKLDDRFTLIKSTEFLSDTQQQIRLIMFDDQSEVVSEFEGLTFYSYEPQGIVTANYKQDPIVVPVILDTERGMTKRFYKLGSAEFEYNNETISLPMYSYTLPEKSEGITSLFTGFTDATSGKTSYGVGRYLDVVGFGAYPPTTVTIDLNRLYNPYCARTDAYNCPVIPTHIDAAIPMGESFEDAKR